MKKLTAGIFATLLTMVSVDGAYAAIASQGYVDEQVGAVSTEVDTLSTTVGQHTTQIGTINTTLEGKVDDADIADMQVKSNLVKTAGWDTGKTDDTKYPSAAAVNDAIIDATSSLPSNTTITEIQGDITDIQGDVTQLRTDVSAKQDKNMGAGAANHIVTTDGTGNITSSATITQAQVSGLGTALAGKADAADLDTKLDANAAITAGTGTKITYDAKGLVTGSSNLTAADIPALTTDKITGLDTELGSKASQTDLTALTGRVTTAEGDIGALQAPKAQVAEGVTGPVSGGTVYTAIENVTGNVGTVTGRVDTLEGEMDQAQSDITKLQTGKQDKLTGPVGSATQPVYVNAEGNVVAGTAYGALATMDTVGSDQIDNGAVTQAKIGANAVGTTQIADGAVTTGKIADGTITNADISNAAEIAMAKIAGLEEALAGVIEKPEGCQGAGSDCVLVIKDGTIQWEDVARGTSESSN